MVLLGAFAFLAGAGTALSPCVLPVLPAVLSAGATGGRRRPLGIVAGLTVTFTVTIVGAAAVTSMVGVGDALTRDIAIAALALFGFATLVTAVGDRIEARLSPLARRRRRRRRARGRRRPIPSGRLSQARVSCAIWSSAIPPIASRCSGAIRCRNRRNGSRG